MVLGGMAPGRVVSALVSCTVDSWFSCTAGRGSSGSIPVVACILCVWLKIFAPPT